MAISLGLADLHPMSTADQIISLVAGLAAIVVIAAAIFLRFAYADRVRSLLGQGGTDIAARLSAFILFCLGDNSMVRLQRAVQVCAPLEDVRRPYHSACRPADI